MSMSIPDVNMDELDKLQPGDMVFAKLGPYPWWPATIALCFQPKHKNMYRVGTEPSKSKFWVQFFNENSGAFVPFKNTRVFRPGDANSYLTKPGANLHDKQKVAIEMALQDYNILQDMDQPNDPISSSIPEGAALQISKKAASALSDCDRSGKEDVNQEVGSRKRKRPSKQDQPDNDAPVAKSHRRTFAADVETEDEDSDSDEGLVVARASRKVSSSGISGKSRRASKKSNGSPGSGISNIPKETQFQLQTLRSAVEEKDRELLKKETYIQKLQLKIEKLTNDPNPRKVRILLPLIPKDVPVVLPAQSDRATEDMDIEEFAHNISTLKTLFDNFERECLRASKADQNMTIAARESLHTLRPLHKNVKDASEAVLSSERKVGDVLKRLYSVKVSEEHLTESNVGKLLNRIAKRSVANSRLINTLSTALRSAWLDLLQDVESSRSFVPPNIPKDGTTEDRESPSSPSTQQLKVPENSYDGSDSAGAKPEKEQSQDDHRNSEAVSLAGASSGGNGSPLMDDDEKSSVAHEKREEKSTSEE